MYLDILLCIACVKLRLLVIQQRHSHSRSNFICYAYDIIAKQSEREIQKKEKKHTRTHDAFYVS